MGGRAAQAQVYPERLCRAICLGVKEQLRDDEENRRTPVDLGKVRADIKRATQRAGRSGGTEDMKELNGLMHCED
eukprot:15345334-Heterocapsa_arctica.AAC.1